MTHPSRRRPVMRFWRRLVRYLMQPTPWSDEYMNEHDQPDEQDGYETDAAGTFKG